MYEMIVPENIGDLFPGQPIADMAGKPDLVYLQISPGVLLELFYPKPGTNLNSSGPNYTKNRLCSSEPFGQGYRAGRRNASSAGH